MKFRPTVPAGSPLHKAEPAAAGELTVALIGSRHFEDVTVPRTATKGRMRLLTRGESREVRQAARAACAAMGIPENRIEISREFLEDMAVRTIAVAIRQPGNVELALASLDEWLEADDDQIGPLWNLYNDLEERLDPLDAECTEEEIDLIRAAAKKKDLPSLRSFGSRRLASYLRTTANQPAN